MPISIVGTGSITGLSAGGLPDASIVTADITDSAVTTGKLAQPLTLATAQNSTSGTAIDFTGIPSWAKRLTVMLQGVSLSGTAHFLIQIGSGSITSSGYSSHFGYLVSDTNANSTSSTSGFGIWGSLAAQATNGAMQINLLNPSSFVYVSSHSAGDPNGASVKTGGGAVTLSGLLDRVRITTTNGTDTFDAGSINIMYEG